MYKVTEYHLISKAEPDKEDFTRTNDSEIQYGRELLIKIMDRALSERIEIAMAITKAKMKYLEQTGMDIDAIASANKSRHIANEAVKSLCGIQPTVREVQNGGIGYRFNVEGNQMPYKYDIRIESQPNVDKAYAVGWLRESQTIAEHLSNEIDRAYINTEVDFVPEFDIRISFDELIEEYKNK